MTRTGNKGFIVVEILIAALILTSSIAATMYLFRMGFDHLQRANQSNVLSSKLTQATGLMRTLDVQQELGEEDLGDDVILMWKSKLLGSSKPIIRGEAEVSTQSPYELLFYRVDFSLQYKGNVREYQINVFRYKMLYSPGEVPL
jgi:hypothetical protein